MFELTKDEYENLRCQFGTSNSEGHGGRRYLPYVFTEQGVAMLSSILNSERAIQVNIIIMTTFVKIRDFVGHNKEVLKKLEILERKYEGHDQRLNEIFVVIRNLMSPPLTKRRAIGIKSKKE